MKIAAIQLSAGSDSDRTLKKAAQFLEAASMKGVRIACFAELFAWPWFPAERSDAAFELAEPLGGRITGRMAELGRQIQDRRGLPVF